MGSRRTQQNSRALIANEAARILSEQGDLSLHLAKQKAAKKLGVTHKHALPDDTEVEAAVKVYQQLYQVDEQPRELEMLRQTAQQAMTLFEAFSPRLVGGVKSGTANKHSAIRLNLFCEAEEDVCLHLINNNIPWRDREIICQYTGNRTQRHHMISFRAGDTKVELLLLPIRALRNPPLSLADGSPERGISKKELSELLAIKSPPPGDGLL